MNHQVVLLLTGCVQPNIKNDVLAIKDVETRKISIWRLLTGIISGSLKLGRSLI